MPCHNSLLASTYILPVVTAFQKKCIAAIMLFFFRTTLCTIPFFGTTSYYCCSTVYFFFVCSSCTWSLNHWCLPLYITIDRYESKCGSYVAASVVVKMYAVWFMSVCFCDYPNAFHIYSHLSFACLYLLLAYGYGSVFCVLILMCYALFLLLAVVNVVSTITWIEFFVYLFPDDFHYVRVISNRYNNELTM